MPEHYCNMKTKMLEQITCSGSEEFHAPRFAGQVLSAALEFSLQTALAL